MRDVLLVVLGVTAGATDATALERLGRAFASVVTGNLVLVGIGGIRREGSLALFPGCAVLGYVLGVLVAFRLRRQDRGKQQIWPAAASVALASGGVLLLAFAIGWEATGGRPGHAMQLVLALIVAVAMGIQSEAVRRLGPFSTTYLTGTLTGLLESVASRKWSIDQCRGLGIIIAVVAGAATATLLIDHTPAYLPLVPLVPLVIVLIGSRRIIAAEKHRR